MTTNSRSPPRSRLNEGHSRWRSRPSPTSPPATTTSRSRFRSRHGRPRDRQRRPQRRLRAFDHGAGERRHPGLRDVARRLESSAALGHAERGTTSAAARSRVLAPTAERTWAAARPGPTTPGPGADPWPGDHPGRHGAGGVPDRRPCRKRWERLVVPDRAGALEWPLLHLGGRVLQRRAQFGDPQGHPNVDASVPDCRSLSDAEVDPGSGSEGTYVETSGSRRDTWASPRPARVLGPDNCPLARGP